MATAQGLVIEENVVQGFNFDKTVQDPCGFVTKLKIGDKEFAADMEVDNIGEDGKLSVVGVLSQFEWSTTSTDPIILEMRVSVTSKQNIMALNLLEMKKNDVVIQFVTYNFDPKAQMFYKEVHCADTDIKGLVQKAGGRFDLTVSSNPATEVRQPLNYFARLGFNSVDEDQTIHISTSSTDKGTKQFGKKLTG